MKDLQFLSTECLRAKRENLLKDIESYEEALKVTRSQIWGMLYRSMIRKWKGQIHSIDAELKFRDEEVED